MLMADFIQPRTLKGFRDYPPELMIPRERLLEQALRVYRFTDHGGRDVALRFDLTVPFARFAAEHIGKLGAPFKRYHMGPVWRGENTAHGRFREFWQCDFDIIGATANAADIEIALVICDLMRALGLERFRIGVNN